MMIKQLPLLTMILALVAGCSSTDGTYEINVQGKVTFDGQPIPVGVIQFIPVGGDGSQGFAKIKDGTYDTAAGSPARGINAGEHLVKIVGYDGVAYEDEENEVNGNGSLLFSQYQVKKTFGADDRSFDVNVPRNSIKLIHYSNRKTGRPYHEIRF